MPVGLTVAELVRLLELESIIEVLEGLLEIRDPVTLGVPLGDRDSEGLGVRVPVGLAVRDSEGLTDRDSVMLGDREPVGLTDRDPVMLGDRDPVGLTVNDPEGLADRDPVGLTVSDPEGLADRDSVPLGVSEPEGLTMPLGVTETDELIEIEGDRGTRPYEIEKIGSPFAFTAIGTAVGKRIVSVEFCGTMRPVPVKSTVCH